MSSVTKHGWIFVPDEVSQTMLRFWFVVKNISAHISTRVAIIAGIELAWN